MMSTNSAIKSQGFMVKKKAIVVMAAKVKSDFP